MVRIVCLSIVAHVTNMVQHRYTKMITHVDSKSYEERLRRLQLWTFEERINMQDLIELKTKFWDYICRYNCNR